MAETAIVLRLLLALLFGTLIGIERQWRHKTAGLKTNALVSLGGAIFGLISHYGFGPGSNPAQVAAGVVTGIGFIGAGVILRQGANVQGVNSATTLWVTAGIGLAVGLGFIKLAGLALPLVLVAQFALRYIAEWIDTRTGHTANGASYDLLVTCEVQTAAHIHAQLEHFAAQPGIEVLGFAETKRAHAAVSFHLTCHLAPARTRELALLSRGFSALAGVHEVKWSKTEVEPHLLG